MVGVLIRMKLTLLRNSLADQGRAAWMVLGGIVGLVLAAGTIWLALLRVDNPTVVPDLLAAVCLVWTVGWMVGPIWGGATVLRAEHFTLLSVPRRRLAVGLLFAAFVGITTVDTLVAFASIVVYGARLGTVPALVAVPGALLLLAFVVLLSRVAVTAFGVVSTSRVGAAFTGVVFAVMMVLLQSGWMIYVAVQYSGVLTAGFGDAFGTWVRALPSGWALVAVESADTGAWWRVAAALAGLVLLVVVLLLVWSRSLGTPRRVRATIRGSRAAGVPAGGSTRAVLRKELRTWRRDPLRTQSAVIPLVWAVGTCLLPLGFGAKVLLPFAAPALAVMAAACLVNLYGQDGTALWLTLQTSSERADVRARQWAYAVIFAPITAALAVGFTSWSGLSWAWPWVLGLTPAIFGGGVGLATLVSVTMLAPWPDAHKRTDNPLERGNTTGQANLLFWGGLLPAAPPAVLLVLGTHAHNEVLRWAGVPVGVATGVLLAWWLGRVAVRVLQARGPELLFTMRTGRSPVTRAKVQMSKKDARIVSLGWTFGPILLFPQGIVPMILLVVDPSVRVWFLAMYLPVPLGWACAAVMAVLGSWVIWLAVRAGRRRKRVGEALLSGGVTAR